MMDFKLTPDEMNHVQAYLDGTEPNIAFTDLPDKVLRLAEAVKHKMLEDAKKAIRAKVSLEKRIARMQEIKEKDYVEGKFEEKNRDSLEVAYAIKYIANSHGIYIKRTMLIPVLFDVYANWLYSAKEILIDEQPKAIESGPQFWKVYNKIDMKLGVDSTRRFYESLAAFNPGVIAVIKNVLTKYVAMDEKRVAEIMKNNLAYKNADKSHNGGKWNKVITPADIYLWKKQANNK